MNQWCSVFVLSKTIQTRKKRVTIHITRIVSVALHMITRQKLTLNAFFKLHSFFSRLTEKGIYWRRRAEIFTILCKMWIWFSEFSKPNWINFWLKVIPILYHPTRSRTVFYSDYHLGVKIFPVKYNQTIALLYRHIWFCSIHSTVRFKMQKKTNKILVFVTLWLSELICTPKIIRRTDWIKVK